MFKNKWRKLAVIVLLLTALVSLGSYKYPDPAVPVGTIIAFPTGTPPTGYLECDGASLLTATYGDLFAVISDDYGNVDGTHFNLPDYRGDFLRGWDHARGVDPGGRTDRGDGQGGDFVGTKQAEAYLSHQHDMLTSVTSGGGIYFARAGTNTSTIQTQLEGGSETRPINVNVMYCIKY